MKQYRTFRVTIETEVLVPDGATGEDIEQYLMQAVGYKRHYRIDNPVDEHEVIDVKIEEV